MFTGNNPAVNGSFRVVGNTGAIAAHAVPFANDLVLFLIRPNARIDFGGDTTALPDQKYLLVSFGRRLYCPGSLEGSVYPVA